MRSLKRKVSGFGQAQESAGRQIGESGEVEGLSCKRPGKKLRDGEAEEAKRKAASQDDERSGVNEADYSG